MEKAIVNRIIPFSSVDGPGNRTAIFLQGCNINCLYCHNPETINICSKCGECISQCPKSALYKDAEGNIRWSEKECIQCDRCIEICRFNSSPKVKMYSVEELLQEIKQYEGFIQGITLSGGECTLQWKFISELFKRTKELGLTNYIDTNGTVKLWDKDELISVTDKFMIDFKAGCNDEHFNLTGEGNSNVFKNIEVLGAKDKIYEIRSVILPGVLNNEETVRIGSELIENINPKIRYKLIKFRNHGVREVAKAIQSPEDSYMEYLKEMALNIGCKDVQIL